MSHEGPRPQQCLEGACHPPSPGFTCAEVWLCNHGQPSHLSEPVSGTLVMPFAHRTSQRPLPLEEVGGGEGSAACLLRSRGRRGCLSRPPCRAECSTSLTEPGSSREPAAHFVLREEAKPCLEAERSFAAEAHETARPLQATPAERRPAGLAWEPGDFPHVAGLQAFASRFRLRG